jgi:transcriptional regulator with PAS, ATPase and Fis domain
VQSKLLRGLLDHEIMPVGGTQGIPVDVRLITSSSERLENCIRMGQFREDLFYRLSMIPIEVPPLRERMDDIPLLVNHFLGQINEKEHRGLTIEKQALRAIRSYDWPGNIFELETVIRQAAAQCESNLIALADLPGEVQSALSENAAADSTAQLRGQSLKAFLRAKEKDYIQFVLTQCGGSKEKAAAALGISLATFYRKYGGGEG